MGGIFLPFLVTVLLNSYGEKTTLRALVSPLTGPNHTKLILEDLAGNSNLCSARACPIFHRTASTFLFPEIVNVSASSTE